MLTKLTLITALLIFFLLSSCSSNYQQSRWYTTREGIQVFVRDMGDDALEWSWNGANLEGVANGPGVITAKKDGHYTQWQGTMQNGKLEGAVFHYGSHQPSLRQIWKDGKFEQSTYHKGGKIGLSASDGDTQQRPNNASHTRPKVVRQEGLNADRGGDLAKSSIPKSTVSKTLSPPKGLNTNQENGVTSSGAFREVIDKGAPGTVRIIQMIRGA